MSSAMQNGTVSGNQVVRLSGNQVIRKSGSPDHPITRSPDTPIRYKAGFSLMELMVVVVIIGIMITTAAVWFANSRERINLKNSTRDVASLLRLAYTKAIADRVNYRVVLALDDSDNDPAETFWLERGNMAGVAETEPSLEYTKTGEPGTAERKVHKFVDLHSAYSESYTTGTWYAIFRPRGTSSCWDGSESGTLTQNYTVTLKNTDGTISNKIRVKIMDSSIEVDYNP